MVDLLETLVKRHCLGSTAEHTATTVTYLKAGKQRKTTIYFLFQAKTEALALKLRCLELEVLNATYTKDSVSALRKVKKFKSIPRELDVTRLTKEQLPNIGIDQS